MSHKVTFTASTNIDEPMQYAGLFCDPHWRMNGNKLTLLGDFHMRLYAFCCGGQPHSSSNRSRLGLVHDGGDTHQFHKNLHGTIRETRMQVMQFEIFVSLGCFSSFLPTYSSCISFAQSGGGSIKLGSMIK